MWILISWLLQKPADLDLHCLQEVISCFILYFKSLYKCLNTVRYIKATVICFYGLVKFSLDKYIMAIYLSLGKYNFLLFPNPCSGAQWLSGRVLDSRPRGRGFQPNRRHCVVVFEQDTFILA